MKVKKMMTKHFIIKIDLEVKKEKGLDLLLA